MATCMSARSREASPARFEDVNSLARHSLSHAVRRIVKDEKPAKFTPHDLGQPRPWLNRCEYRGTTSKRCSTTATATLPPSMPAGTCSTKREAVLAIEQAVLPLTPMAVAARL